MKILITNAVALNTGDAAILYGTIALLRRAFGSETSFLVLGAQPTVCARYYPELTFKPLLYSAASRTKGPRALARPLAFLTRLRVLASAWCWSHGLVSLAQWLLSGAEAAVLSEYASADLVVSAGGTYLVEHYGLAHRLFDYRIALQLRKPLIFFTQSLGPFTKRRDRRTLKRIFDRSVAVLLRDAQSLTHLRDLGAAPPRVHVTSDAAFVLAPQAAPDSPTVPSRSRPRVAISIRNWRRFPSPEGRDKYIDAFALVSTHLVTTHRAEITYISSCQGVPEYRIDDSRVAQEVVRRLPDAVVASVVIDSVFHDPHGLMNSLRQYDLVIAMRMHVAILALLVGVPVIPVAYEFKTRELFVRLGQQEWLHDVATISPAKLVATVDAILDRLPTVRKQLVDPVQYEVNAAFESARLVRQAYEESRRGLR